MRVGLIGAGRIGTLRADVLAAAAAIDELVITDVVVDRAKRLAVEVGLSATELGPDGHLPRDAEEMAEHLKQYNVRAVGGLVPAVLYRPDLIDSVLAYVDRTSQQLARVDSQVMVLGPASHLDGYGTSIDMTD